MHGYILRRRGVWTDPARPNVVVVIALSEAHARVAAYNRTGDSTWLHESWASCLDLDYSKERVYA